MKKVVALVLALILVLTAVTALAADPSKKEGDIKQAETKTTEEAKTEDKKTEETKTEDKKADDKKDTTKPAAPAPGGFPAPAPKAGINVVLTDDNDETKEIVKKMTEAGADKVLEVIPEEMKKDLPEEFTQVNEISTWKIEGDPTGIKEVEVKFTFESPYKVDEEVKLFLSVPKTEGKEWIMLDGKVDAENKVVTKFTDETIKKLGFDPFVVVVVNKPET